jgi:hypothetical protein
MQIEPSTLAKSQGAKVGPAIETEITGRKPITLRLVTREDDADCSFWVGFASHGSVVPTKLMDGEIPAILARAAKEGLADKGPVMLSDSTRDPPRYIYLLPLSQPQESQRWVETIVETIRAWAPANAGFYFAPELITNALAGDLLLQVLKGLVKNSPTTSYYLLVGTQGTNAVLNIALRLRQELLKDTVNLYVFH